MEMDGIRKRIAFFCLRRRACLRAMSHSFDLIVDIGDGSPPLLFLLDEMLHGTNSHDRRIGAEAVIRGLVDRGEQPRIEVHTLRRGRAGGLLGRAIATPERTAKPGQDFGARGRAHRRL